MQSKLILAIFVISLFSKTREISNRPENLNHSIKVPFDSLKNYSQPIYGYNKRELSEDGTGFYYQSKSKEFVVSNFHVFSGWDEFTNTRTTITTDILVRYRKKDFSNDLFVFPLINDMANLGNKINIYNNIDLYKLPIINRPKNARLLFINDLLDTSYFNKIPEEVVTFGYPGDSSQKFNNPKKVTPFFLKGNYQSYRDWCNEYSKKYPSPIMKERDMQVMDEKYFFLTSPCQLGMSGSPVFGKFVISGSNPQKYNYKFFGVLLGVEKDTKKSWVIKGRVAYEYLEGRRSQ